jgi:predicted nucleic acid-binding Zn ribbon protein
MPIHDLYCPHCSYTLDNYWTLEVDFIRLCPRCDTVMKKEFHPSSLRFKGEGWETNDHKPKKESSDV